MIARVIRQTEHLGRDLEQFGQVVGYKLLMSISLRHSEANHSSHPGFVRPNSTDLGSVDGFVAIMASDEDLRRHEIL